ncbi:glycosyltransferase family 2 protein [Duganella sp. BJB488]|uniref:glycosyltransferase family 2 protein n=1 Tax=unclassified Duganella TaxID=2636909 RepID=UPI000E342BE7|nr:MULTISPECIES: glycosyltransferase family 2 protein [unclassified Duganella]RFP11614.1 glycosyltransferase family 2 protein [Duganella sp. BJB489]RFP15672.1 glycosyltransferase family 2 protein [Duganella sp. BJB488]RFP30619.1 glycosyltransferase family 2 protein [Duganella sp. BJB480]
MRDFKPCIVVPVYNHAHAIGAVVAGLLRHGAPCILVDDGSSAACAAVLDALARQHAGTVSLVRLAQNQGKGVAVLSGFRRAAELGYTHVLQIDADGQHETADVPKFLAQAVACPDAIIAGHPVYDESVPKARLYGRYATHIWVWINTLSFDIKDSMCGFRVYPVAPVNALAARSAIGARMNFDTDILVRLFWDGLQVVNLPTRVSYPSDGVSHFRVWSDNVRISWMHTKLFFGMLPRIPRLLARKRQVR